MRQALKARFWLAAATVFALAGGAAYARQCLEHFGRDDTPVPERAQVFPIDVKEKWGFIDKQGHVVVEPKYDEIIDAEDQGYVALGGHGWVLVDRKGEHDVLRFSRQPEFVTYVGDGLFFGELKPIEGHHESAVEYCDLRGQFPSDFDGRALHFPYFNEGLLPVEKDGKWGFVRRDGSWAIEPEFVYAGSFNDGLAPVRVANRLFGYVDHKGALAIKPEYEFAGRFWKGLAVVRREEREWFIRTDRTRAFQADFKAVGTFRWGLANVHADNGRYGYIDRTGDYAIPPRFASAQSFSCGLARVRDPITKDWLYIDTKGQSAIVIRDVQWAQPEFYKGLAVVRTMFRKGYVNTSGEWVWWRTLEPAERQTTTPPLKIIPLPPVPPDAPEPGKPVP